MYFAAPIWAQNTVANVYGLHLRYLRYGAAQRAYLSELRSGERLDPALVRGTQLHRLRSVVHHAYTTVPLYRERGIPPKLLDLRNFDDLRALPVVTKDDLRRPRRD